MPKTYKVIDLFAGPGGLAEGFASLEVGGHRPFEIALSVEKEASAHATLRLRSFVRQFKGRLPRDYLRFLGGSIEQPEWASHFPAEWEAAEEHALRLELGTEHAAKQLAPRIHALEDEETIVIGGPPCQAYSIVGRARNRGTQGYEAREDPRHFLYKEYINILQQVRPIAFVMENVKGLLSSKVDGVRILDLVLRDLRSAGGSPDSYRLVALAPSNTEADLFVKHEPDSAAEFLIQAEDHGVPQTRHRMIIVGIRADHQDRLDALPSGHLMPKWTEGSPVGVEQVLSGLPPIRSGLSRGDEFQTWRDAALDAMDDVLAAVSESEIEEAHAIQDDASLLRNSFWMRCPVLPRSATMATRIERGCPQDLARWIEGAAGGRIANHESRSHMPSDLSRYFFSAVFAMVHGRSPKAEEFPTELAPDHKNWSSGHFVDRFRVQQNDRPASTITSHISKDGHYFIHPDPLQCRALTVREAARLQTFPDDYMFLGSRTEQFIQVGNAVPPYLAKQIAEALFNVLDEGAVEEAHHLSATGGH